jgi:hypothetical protein
MKSSVNFQKHSNQHRIARLKGSNPFGAARRHQAIRLLVRCLEMNPSRQEWSEATDSVLLGCWPNIMTMPSAEQQIALAKLVAIVKEARARVRAKLTPEQLALNEMAQEPVLAAQEQSTHQAAVNSLLELAMAAHWPDAKVAIPFEQVPALFRAAVEEATAAASRHPYPNETDLVEQALIMIEHNGGDANIRTPEQKQFYADLAFESVDDQVRVTYSPSNVTIH